MIAHLTPAYGKDYRAKREIVSTLKGGGDFILNDPSSRWNNRPINLPQLKEAGYTSVTVRFNKLKRVTSVTLSKL